MQNPEATAAVLRRRTILRWTACAGGGWLGSPVFSQEASAQSGAEPPRLALLIGNRNYPGGDDLPPIHKNVRDLRGALEMRGFAVTIGLDLDLVAARELVNSFVARVLAAPVDSTVFFYFAGHGAQVDAENLLVSANVSPKLKADALVKGSLALVNDVVSRLPRRPAGMTMAVIDACRTSLQSAQESNGLNQVEAPLGCLIAFATGAGKAAIAPNDEKLNTFYTASLVKLLVTASDETSFSDLFRLVKADTQQTMLNHPVQLLRQFAQCPFIAENTKIRRRIAPLKPVAPPPPLRKEQEPEAVVKPVAPAPPLRKEQEPEAVLEPVAPPPPLRKEQEPEALVKPVAPPPPPRKEDESQAWAKLEALSWPAEVAKAAIEYLKNYPESQLVGSAQVARDGASEAAQILRRSNVRLYRSAFQALTELPNELVGDIYKAGRGDKDAAARLGRHYGRPLGGGAQASASVGRFEGWMQYAAALGNGIASYQLSLYYRRTDQPQLASEYESRAQELGYTPPPSLDNKRS